MQPDGVELRVLSLEPEEMFYRMARLREFDVSELSLSTYTCSGAAASRWSPIPVFPSFMFRHSAIWVRTARASGSRGTSWASVSACPSTT